MCSFAHMYCMLGVGELRRHTLTDGSDIKKDTEITDMMEDSSPKLIPIVYHKGKGSATHLKVNHLF